ncbi:hypothetical protein [Fluviicola taffensis]|uniref:hypothetical protein n=1 Tax=Fluviicola taffensis TaxID=191579 RepID=UPI0031377480
MTLVIIADILMFFYIAKLLIDVNAFATKLSKEKVITSNPNKLEKEYQFIKGLY